MQEVIINYKSKPKFSAEILEKTDRPNAYYELNIKIIKSRKCLINANYSTLENAIKALTNFQSSITQKEAGDKSRREKAFERLVNFKNQISVGTVLCDSWGYEQTNVDFYIIKSINEAKTKISIQEIGHIRVEGSEGRSGMSCSVIPDTERELGSILTKIIRADRIKIDSSVSLRIWDGKPMYKSWYY